MIYEDRNLHSLITLEEFKAIMGIDARDDKTALFCLVTSSLSIEQYCKRKFLRKQYFETIPIENNLVIPFREYPVVEILAVYSLNKLQFVKNKSEVPSGEILEPEFYRPMLGNDYNEEMMFELLLSPSLKPYNLVAVKVIYWAGYEHGAVPEDLSAACLELASWNFNRYKGKRIGMTGNIKGAGVQGEHFELSMPENVKALIEPYRRKTI